MMTDDIMTNEISSQSSLLLSPPLDQRQQLLPPGDLLSVSVLNIRSNEIITMTTHLIVLFIITITYIQNHQSPKCIANNIITTVIHVPIGVIIRTNSIYIFLEDFQTFIYAIFTVRRAQRFPLTQLNRPSPDNQEAEYTS